MRFRKHTIAMYETVNEPIGVLASFAHNRVIPHAFTWNGRRYTIRNVHLTHVEQDHGERIMAFAVTDNSQAFNLHFHPQSLRWILHEVFIDGG